MSDKLGEPTQRTPLSIQISGEPGTGEFLAAYICFTPGKIARTKEQVPGSVFVDVDINGKILGVELLDFQDISCIVALVKDESEEVRNFARWLSQLQPQLAHAD
jgi:uncharacterized protein YuzE